MVVVVVVVVPSSFNGAASIRTDIVTTNTTRFNENLFAIFEWSALQPRKLFLLTSHIYSRHKVVNLIPRSGNDYKKSQKMNEYRLFFNFIIKSRVYCLIVNFYRFF